MTTGTKSSTTAQDISLYALRMGTLAAKTASKGACVQTWESRDAEGSLTGFTMMGHSASLECKRCQQ